MNGVRFDVSPLGTAGSVAFKQLESRFGFIASLFYCVKCLVEEIKGRRRDADCPRLVIDDESSFFVAMQKRAGLRVPLYALRPGVIAFTSA